MGARQFRFSSTTLGSFLTLPRWSRNAFSSNGIDYKESGLGLACDAYTFKRVTDNKTEVVVLGPAGGNPHGMDEYVDLDTFFDLIKIMVLTAIDYCGTE